MKKLIQKIVQQQVADHQAYCKFSDTGKIGMILPAKYTCLSDGPSCPIKLKPPKYPKGKSKRIYRGLFIRPLGAFKHIYSIEANLYVVSLQKEHNEQIWIDKHFEKITRRINEYRIKDSTNIASN
jgi:hypothetical protein